MKKSELMKLTNEQLLAEKERVRQQINALPWYSLKRKDLYKYLDKLNSEQLRRARESDRH